MTLKILLVDDEPAICNLVKLHFQTEGYLVYCKAEIDVDFSYLQPFLTITVKDDGEGFTARDRAVAVHYFYKGKKEKEHFGLGLTVCRILAEKHGGSIFLDNAPDGGARVAVKLKMEEISAL